MSETENSVDGNLKDRNMLPRTADGVSNPPSEDFAPTANAEKQDMTSQPPDGGVTAWMVVLGAWCTSFCSFGWINSE